MNTGLAFATTLKIDFYDNDNRFLYSKDYNFLDSFGTFRAISESEFVRFEEDAIKERRNAFVSYIENQIGKTFQIISENKFVEENTQLCSIAGTKQQNISTEVETSLRRNDRVQSEVFFETNFDGVQSGNNEGYFIEIGIRDSDNINELDYHKSTIGQLIYKVGVDRTNIVFDINDKGELIVIGPDADAYSINDKGELIYNIDHVKSLV